MLADRPATPAPGDLEDLPEETTGTRSLSIGPADAKGEISAQNVAEGHAPGEDFAPADVRDARRRRTGARAATVSIRRTSKTELRRGAELYPPGEDLPPRPRVRAECVDGHRPCPFVSCRYNLFLDVHPTRGSIKLNFPDREPDEMGESCALDVADRGGQTLEQVGAAMNVTRERLRQLEVEACERIEKRVGRDRLRRLLEATKGED